MNSAEERLWEQVIEAFKVRDQRHEYLTKQLREAFEQRDKLIEELSRVIVIHNKTLEELKSKAIDDILLNKEVK